LEISCNTGHLIKELVIHPRNVVDVDINNAAPKIANMPNLFCMDIGDMGFPDSFFDKIICLQTIEHVQKIKRASEGIARVLKPGGSVLLIYPFEIIRDIGAMRCSLATCSSKWHTLLNCPFISKTRRLHIYKLFPREISKLIAGKSLTLAGSNMILDPWPLYITILKQRKKE